MASQEAVSMASFLDTPVRMLNSASDAPLMSGVLRDGSRSANGARKSAVFGTQTYEMRNNHTVVAGITGENTMYAPKEVVAASTASAVSGSKANEIPVFSTTLVRDGSIIGYIIKDIANGADLLKVYFHGDTSSGFQRATKVFFRSPVPKWDVENAGLFTDMRIGKNLGLIRDVFPDHRVFEPDPAFAGVPRLEMQAVATLGTRYYLAVSGIPEPVGEVTSGMIGRFTQRSEQYRLVLRNCPREEAVLWTTMIIATDMKRRKSQNTKRGPVGIYF